MGEAKCKRREVMQCDWCDVVHAPAFNHCLKCGKKLMGKRRRTYDEMIECREATKCKYGDPLCPCQDGDLCHYEGKNPMKRREATIEDLMQAQADCNKHMSGVAKTFGTTEVVLRGQNPPLSQSDMPPELNVFATMEAAWQDLVDRWFHEGMPDKLKQDGKFIFYHGVQAAANLMMYCEGQDMFGAAADQVQGDCIAYEKEAEAVLAERKADEWRTGEI